MSVQVENLEKNMAKLTIEVAAEEVEKAIQSAYLKEKGKISLPGFRKGKVPRKMIEKMYGEAVFYEDAANTLIQENYPGAVEESGVDIVSRPTIDVVQIESGKPFIFTAEVAVRPEVKLGKYLGVQVTKVDTSVSDEEVEEALEKERNNNARTISVTDRPVANGDTAVIDFEGFVDGVAFEGGKGENHSLEIGSHSFIDTFEDQLVGKNVGDDVEVNVTFPEQYQAAELAGKPAMFKVKIHEIKCKELPELNDEFAQDVSEFDTLADFKKDLGEKLKERRETQNQRDFEAALMEQVMDNMEVEIPDAMVEYEADNLVNDMAQRIQAQGIPFDQYLAMTGMTMDIMREQAKAAALERVRRELALGAIVAAENITISDEELEEEYKRLAEQYHMEVDKVKAAVTADSIRKEQSYHKAEHVVYDSAKVGKAPAKKKSTKKKAEESAEGEEKPKKTARKGTSRKKVEETAEAAVEKTEE